MLPNANGIRVPIEQVFTDPSYRYRSDNDNYRVDYAQVLGEHWTWNTSVQYQRHDEFRKISFVSGISPDQRTVTIGLSRYLAAWKQDDGIALSTLTGRSDVFGLPNLVVAGLQYRVQDYRSPPSQSGAVAVDLANPNVTFDDSAFTSAPAPGSRFALNQRSAFAVDQLSVGPVNLIGGLRYDDVGQSSRSTTAGASKTFSAQDKVSWTAGLVWEALAGLNLYASVNTGFEAASPGSNDATGKLFDPQESKQYEVGAKWNAPSRVFVTGSLFQITRTNVLTPDPNNALATIQTGEVRSRGGELEASGDPAPGWKLLAAYTFLDPIITKDTTTPGKTFANIPRHATRLFTTYRIGSGTFEGLGFGGGHTWRSRRYADNANTLPLGAYGLVDALAWYEIGKRYRVQLNVANLFDREFYANGRNALRVYPGTPRTVLLTLKATLP